MNSCGRRHVLSTAPRPHSAEQFAGLEPGLRERRLKIGQETRLALPLAQLWLLFPAYRLCGPCWPLHWLQRRGRDSRRTRAIAERGPVTDVTVLVETDHTRRHDASTNPVALHHVDDYFPVGWTVTV